MTKAPLRKARKKKETPLQEALRAIRFALNIDDHYNMREFLDGWTHGDTSEWPEFAAGKEGPDPD